MTSGETVGVPVSVGVNVAVDITVGVMLGIGVIVEIAITLLPNLQLARTKTEYRKYMNLFATMTTSKIVALLSYYLSLHAPNYGLSGVTPYKTLI